MVTLLPFQDYIDDPSLIVALMTDQGVEDVADITDLSPLGGGTSDNNYKGYLQWTNGTSTKVQVKGTRSGETPPTSYRESLFYSRISSEPDYLEYVLSPYGFTDVADMDTGMGFMVNEFMIGYTDLSEV